MTRPEACAARPKVIDLGDELCPVLVFSDGAWEPGASKPEGAGLVVIDPISRLSAVHQVAIPPRLLDSWTASGKKQVITELELWPVVVGMQNLSGVPARDVCCGSSTITL